MSSPSPYHIACANSERNQNYGPRLLGTGALLFGACPRLTDNPLSSAGWYRDVAQRFRDESS